MDYIEPILITGCARSGTSLTAGVIDKCGAWGGTLRGPTKFNQKGMFENREIVDGLIKPILRKMNCDPLGQNPLPRIEVFKRYSVDEISKFRNTVLDIVTRQGYEGGKWYYKGAKMCLMWPLWCRAFPKARWIIVRRAPDDIVASCLRTSFMRAYKTRGGWLKWVAEHELRFEEMYNARLSVQEVWPQRAINGDLTELQLVVNNLELEWDAEEIRKFVTPSLWHRDKTKGQ